ncbi:MAG: hypothetical protein IKH43_07470 [Bacteroidaceae bacterium]|nr:hypothetical protein [Bacteroidaceae bacterium]
MKKLMTMLSAVLLLVGCSGNEYEDWQSPQSHDEDDAIVIPGLTASPVGVINFNDITLSDDFDLQAYVLSGVLPDGYVIRTATMEFDEGTVDADAEGMVSSKALCNYFGSVFGVRPVEREAVARVKLVVMIDGVATNVDAGTITVKAIPQAPEIESNYYITGNINGWINSDRTYVVTNDGSDPYENPTFGITINVDALQGNALEFKLTPESGLGGDWSKCICSADEEGKFNYNNVGGNFWVPAPSNTDKYLRLTFNMLDKTWSYEYIAFAPFIYEIGNEGGWSENHPLASNGDGTYTGFVYLNGEFKFKPNADNWTDDWEWDGDGKISVNGQGNVPAATGLHRIDVDIVNLTYTLSKIDFVDMIGDATAGGWNNGTVLTWDDAEGCFSVITSIAAQGTVKFRGNGTWDNFDGNWGGTLADLINGSNDNCEPTVRGENVKVRFYAKGNCYATMEEVH